MNQKPKRLPATPASVKAFMDGYLAEKEKKKAKRKPKMRKPDDQGIVGEDGDTRHWHFKVAGIKYEKRGEKAYEAQVTKGHKVSFVPEPSNKFDPYAVKVLYHYLVGDDKVRELHLGYIPKEYSKNFCRVIRALGGDLTGQIVQVFKDNKNNRVKGIRVSAETTLKF